MSELTQEQRRACWAIARHYSGDGRWGHKGAGPYWVDGFMITKYRPKLVLWQRSRGRNTRMTHALRYRVRASTGPRTAVLRQISVWWCGSQSTAKTETVDQPITVCQACLHRVNNDPKEVRLR